MTIETRPLEVEVTARGPGQDDRPRTLRVSIGRGYSAFLSITVEGDKRVTAQLQPSALLTLLDALTSAYQQSATNLRDILARLEAEQDAIDAAPDDLSERVRSADAEFNEILNGIGDGLDGLDALGTSEAGAQAPKARVPVQTQRAYDAARIVREATGPLTRREIEQGMGYFKLSNALREAVDRGWLSSAPQHRQGRSAPYVENLYSAGAVEPKL